MEITGIKIKNLFGSSDYNLCIKNNKLIIVAENGGGKTTILKIIYYFLSKQWGILSKYSFDKIEVTINDEIYTYDNTKELKKIDKKIINEIVNSYPIRLELFKVFEDNEFERLKTQPFLIEKIELEKSWRKGQLLEVVNKIKEKTKPNKDFPVFKEIPILYLPTYRRTENEFMKIFSNLNQFTRGFLIDNFEEIQDELDDMSIEVGELKGEAEIEGENDLLEEIQNDAEEVEREIKDKEKRLDNFFSNLWNEFVRIRKSPNDIHVNFAEFGMQDVKGIINNFLSLIKAANGNDKSKLIKKIHQFTIIVQKYLIENKKIDYDDTGNEIFIKIKSNELIIELEQLSSGEKQIISIFAYLYLTEHNYFIIFDEPELSISIFWQKMLLPDIFDAGANGILAATHSPYIYKNDMFENVNSLDNFTQTI